MSASALPFMPLLETKNQDEEAVADAGDNTTGPDEQSLQDSRPSYTFSIRDDILSGPPPPASFSPLDLITRFIGNGFRNEPEDMLDQDTNQCRLTASTQQILKERVFHDLDPSELVDYHCHIVGHGSTGSGCFLHESVQTWWYPIRRIKSAAFMTASQVTDIANGDVQYISRLARLIRKFVPAQIINPEATGFVHGRHCMLPFDKFYEENGKSDMTRTTLYVPNDYSLVLAKELPDAFIAMGSVNPYRTDALRELQFLADNGVKIIKWLPNSMGMNPSDDKCIPFYEKMKELDMVLLSHAGEEHSVDAAFIDNSLGNPLLLRKALDCGVKVIAAHCATEGYAEDLDVEGHPRVYCYNLWLRMMREEKRILSHEAGEYKGLLFGDISAVCGFKRVPHLQQLLHDTDVHDRLVGGTDYPVPAINIVVHTSKLKRWGLITPEECTALNELYQYNPLLFDVACKRLVSVETQDGKRVHFPVSAFKRHPLLPPCSQMTVDT